LHRKKTKNAVDKESSGYFISTVSREVDLSQKTIREYEKMGLVKPRREPRTNNRIYSDLLTIPLTNPAMKPDKRGKPVVMIPVITVPFM